MTTRLWFSGSGGFGPAGNKWATAEAIDEINNRISQVVDDSVRFADESPYPDPQELYRDVYLGEYPYITEG